MMSKQFADMSPELGKIVEVLDDCIQGYLLCLVDLGVMKGDWKNEDALLAVDRYVAVSSTDQTDTNF